MSPLTLRSFVCTDCGKAYFNRAAHTEECPGPVRHAGPCDARATLPERRCRLPYGHTGDHEYARGL